MSDENVIIEPDSALALATELGALMLTGIVVMSRLGHVSPAMTYYYQRDAPPASIAAAIYLDIFETVSSGDRRVEALKRLRDMASDPAIIELADAVQNRDVDETR